MARPDQKAGHLAYEILTPHAVYHASFISGRVRPYTPPHTHDFYEVFYVLEGTIAHVINGITMKLAAGDLVFIRPEDCHSLSGKRFHMINVSFPAKSWKAYCALAGLDETPFLNPAVAPPPVFRVPEDRRQACAAVFGRVLRACQQTLPERVARQALCRFWPAVLDYFLPEEQDAQTGADQQKPCPVWLSHACRAMYEQDNLRGGLARFVEVSGVTRAHLTRTLKAWRGQTPTEFINELRLRRAAMLLSVTPADTIDIAMECGFENIGYFYLLFRRRFGKSPRIWRLEQQCISMPLQD